MSPISPAQTDQIQKSQIEEIQNNLYDLNLNGPLTVDTVSQLSTVIRGKKTIAFIKDLARGGTFSYFLTGYSVDSGVVFPANGGGYWVRQFQGDIHLNWFGAIANNSTDNTTAINNALNYLVSTGGGILQVGRGIYITDGFLLPAKVTIQGQGEQATTLRLKSGSTKRAFVDCLNSYSGVVRDINLDGNNFTGTNIHGVIIETTNSNGYNDNRRNHIYRCLITYFSGDGVHAQGSNTFIFEVDDNDIGYNRGWGIWNSSTDNAFVENTVYVNYQGGIYNAGSNNRFRGGKILFNGYSNINSAGIYDVGFRNSWTGMECQENYYHGVVLSGSHNIYSGIVTDLNNVAARVSSNLSTSAVGYGLMILAGATNNQINCQITSYAAIGDPKHTQFPYWINSTNETDRNMLNISVSPHSKNGIGIIKNIIDQTVTSASWTRILVFNYTGAVDGEFRRIDTKYSIQYNSGYGDQAVRTGEMQVRFQAANAGALEDICTLYLDNVANDIVRIVKKGVRNYELQIRSINAQPTAIQLTGFCASNMAGQTVQIPSVSIADVGDVAATDKTNASFIPYALIIRATVASGDGAATIINLAHGLGTVPSFYNVSPTSGASGSIDYLTADATNIVVHYKTAPTSGIGNLSYQLIYKK